MIPAQNFWLPFLWGLLVLVSWVGWGAILARGLLGPGRRPDLGLCVGWGLCVTLAIGGVLNALRLCSPVTLGALTLAGVLGVVPLARDRWRAFGLDRARVSRAWLALLPLAVWGAVILAGSLTWDISEINPADDLANYLMYPVKMLETGAADDPYSIRRLSTFGGYAFLQAVVAVAGTEKNAFLLDIGLGSIAVVLLLVGAIRRMGGKTWMLYLISATCWLYWMPRVNTMVAWIGTATVLTLLRTVVLRVGESDEARRVRLWVAVAASATASCSLRANYFPLPILFMGAAVAGDAIVRRGSPRALARDGLVLGTAFALLMLPWSWSLHRASGSFLYPLMKGNHHGEIMAYATQSLAQRLGFAARMWLDPKLLRLLPCLLVLPLVGAWPVVWLYGAALATATMTFAAFSTTETVALLRYTVPLLVAPALFGVVALLCAPRPARFRYPFWGGIACAALLLGDAPLPLPEVLARPWAAATVAARDDQPPFQPQLYRRYAAMQRSIPPGASVASVLDFPSLWDFRRHHVQCLDFPGAATPGRPMPFFQGAQALLRYLREEGIDYLAYNDFERSRGMYHRDWYASLVRDRVPTMDRVATHTLDFMANVDTLATTQPLAFDQAGLRVIRIR